MAEVLQTPAELLPAYHVDPETGAWCTLPWPTDPVEKKRIIDNSLGDLVIRWAENRLTPEEFDRFGPGLIHPLTGESWSFTPGQKRFLILWYWHQNGRYVYRRGVKRGSKGTGKDYIAAAHGNIELAGPSQLVWEDGRWTGIQHGMPLVQIASNSEAQSKTRSSSPTRCGREKPSPGTPSRPVPSRPPWQPAQPIGSSQANVETISDTNPINSPPHTPICSVFEPVR